MNKLKFEVKQYQINIKCPKCETGILIWSLTSKGLSYEHFCVDCDHTEILDEVYPKYETEKILVD